MPAMLAAAWEDERARTGDVVDEIVYNEGMNTTEAPSAAPALYLVAELRVRDREKLLRYAAEVQPVMARFGGRILATSVAGHRGLEGAWQPGLLVIHHWRSERDFDAFWQSEDYAPIKQLRRESCDSRIVVFPASGVEKDPSADTGKG